MKDLENQQVPSLPRQLANLPERSLMPVYGRGRRADLHELDAIFNPSSPTELPAFQDVSYAINGFGQETVQLLHKRSFYFPKAIRKHNTLLIGQDQDVVKRHILEPLLIATLRDPLASCVIFTPPGDLFASILVANQELRPSSPIDCLNFADRFRSTRTWSGLGDVNMDDPFSILDAVRVLVTAARNYTPGIDQFFVTAISQLTAAILFRLYEHTSKATLADVLHAVYLPKPKLKELLERGEPNALSTSVLQLLSGDGFNAETFLKQTRAALQTFHDVDIASTTSSTTFQFDQIITTPGTLVVEVPYLDRPEALPLVAAFTEHLFKQIGKLAATSPDGRLARPFALYFVDVPTTGLELAKNPLLLNPLKSSGVEVVATASSLHSVASRFGTDTEFVLGTFGTKMFQSPVDMKDARWAAQLAGETTVNAVHVSEDRSDHYENEFETVGRYVHPAMRPVFEPEQIRFSPKLPGSGHAATVFLPHVPPVQVWFSRKQGVSTNSSSRWKSEPIAVAEWAPSLDSGDQGSELTFASDTLAEGFKSRPRRRMRHQYEALRTQLYAEWDTEEDRKFWADLERDLKHRLAILAGLTTQLLRRGASICEFRVAFDSADTKNLQAVLCFMDYRRFRERANA